MKTPCIKVCKIDLEKSCCIGCGRTLEQIRMWSKYTDEQRLDIMEELNNVRKE